MNEFFYKKNEAKQLLDQTLKIPISAFLYSYPQGVTTQAGSSLFSYYEYSYKKKSTLDGTRK